MPRTFSMTVFLPSLILKSRIFALIALDLKLRLILYSRFFPFISNETFKLRSFNNIWVTFLSHETNEINYFVHQLKWKIVCLKLESFKLLQNEFFSSLPSEMLKQSKLIQLKRYLTVTQFRAAKAFRKFSLHFPIATWIIHTKIINQITINV